MVATPLRKLLKDCFSVKGRQRVVREVASGLGLRDRFSTDLKQFAPSQNATGSANEVGPTARALTRQPFQPDNAQLTVGKVLDGLVKGTLYTVWPFRQAKGLYLHGSVGTGKTMLLDCLATALKEEKRSCLRIHFNDFMVLVHQRLRTGTLGSAAKELAESYKYICFDEFQVTDVADAVLLRELFGTLFENECKIVATSNRSPSRLYENGLNRKALFEPFQSLLEFETFVVDIDSLHGGQAQVPEYRQQKFLLDQLQGPIVLSEREKVDNLFHLLSKATPPSTKFIPVAFGRQFLIPVYAKRVARIPFNQVCESSVGAVDFISLANHCDIIIVDHVPLLNDKLDGVTRRFITLVDILYDRGVKLILSSDFSLDQVFAGVSDSLNPLSGDIHVHDRGGPSGRLTTVLEDGVIWSATGRIGASLARGDDVSFAIARARSRLREMETVSYWNRIPTP